MAESEDLYEPAAPDALLRVGGEQTLYIGTLDEVDWHLHGAPVYIAGVYADFRLRTPGGRWLTCRCAVIPPGVRHALDLRGDPLAVFYPEPGAGGTVCLGRLGHGWTDEEGILMSRHGEIAVFRSLYENRNSLAWTQEALDDVLSFTRCDGTVLDPRVVRIVERIREHPDDLTPIEALAAQCRLSGSRLLHLFTEQIGVPYRRYRLWSRVRAAMREVLLGCSLTEAAHAAGFTDSSHFARSFRDTFGVTPSYVFRKLARASAYQNTNN